MQSMNHWGGSFELAVTDDEQSRNLDLDRAALSRQHLDETQQSWLLGPQESKKKEKYVDLGCVVVKRKLLKWIFYSLLIAFIVIGVPIIIAKSIPKHRKAPPPPDQYTEALHKALMFFNAQKCTLFLSAQLINSPVSVAQLFRFLIRVEPMDQRGACQRTMACHGAGTPASPTARRSPT